MCTVHRLVSLLFARIPLVTVSAGVVHLTSLQAKQEGIAPGCNSYSDLCDGVAFADVLEKYLPDAFNAEQQRIRRNAGGIPRLKVGNLQKVAAVCQRYLLQTLQVPPGMVASVDCSGVGELDACHANNSPCQLSWRGLRILISCVVTYWPVWRLAVSRLIIACWL